MISVRGLTKQYGGVCVDQLTFDVARGEVVGFWAKRRGQDHHHSDVDRSFGAHLRDGACGWPRCATTTCQSQRACGLFAGVAASVS